MPKQPITPENALSRAAALCSRCEQAEWDIRKKLKDWSIPQDKADAIIDRLIDEKYLDEQRYATAFARDKFRFDGWGRIKIAFTLKNKHISASAIENALATIDEDDYLQSLKNALSAKLRTIKGKDNIHTKAALVRFAASRGYEPNLIYSVLPQIIHCDEELY